MSSDALDNKQIIQFEGIDFETSVQEKYLVLLKMHGYLNIFATNTAEVYSLYRLHHI